MMASKANDGTDREGMMDRQDRLKRRLRADQEQRSRLAALAHLPEPVRRRMGVIAQMASRHRLLEDAGWLPHYTTPFDALDDMAEEGDAGALLDSHYLENWASVKASLLDHLQGYGLDAEGIETYREALLCHETGAYRAVTRLVFPEFERLATANFPEAIGQKGGPPGALKEFAANLDLDAVDPGGAESLALFKCLDEHLYRSVHTSEEIERARRDPIPNRHAALHGRVSYAAFRSSMNALIMTDYVFQIIALRAHRLPSSAAQPQTLRSSRERGPPLPSERG